MMDKKRKEIFIDNFSLPEGLVQIAYDKIRRKLEDLAYEGGELEILVEMPLFNVLGVINGRTDIWTTTLRADLAYEVSQKFKPFTDRNNEFDHEEVKKIADEISDRWY